MPATLNRVHPLIIESLNSVMEGASIDRETAYNLINGHSIVFQALTETANRLRDLGKGRYVSYSRKVFIPLTTLCRDRCTYCDFRKEPNHPQGRFMTPDEVLQVAKAGQRFGCTEALFVLGERPEQRYPEARDQLKRLGYNTTMEYVEAMCQLVLKETTLLPHSNPGNMTLKELTRLKEVNASLGLMLENVSERLCAQGGPHEMAPSKRPRARLSTLRRAGELRIPFTTGLLIGIGETPEEVIDSLFAIKELHDTYGHIQEVIIQNFRAKPTIPMRDHPEPTTEYIAKVAAMARVILGGSMNIQVPPNLSPGEYGIFLSAGINDWGGISPVTKDYVNPEAPWPEVEAVGRVCAEKGFELKARLPLYPEYILHKDDYLPDALKERIRSHVDAEGFVKGGVIR